MMITEANFFKIIRRVVALLLAVTLTACIEDEVPTYESTTRVRVGEMAPDFTVEMLSGQSLTLSELRGDVVLLLFFSSWCPDCLAEMTQLDERLAPFAERGFRLVAISRGEPRADIEQFRAEHGFGYDLGLDESRAIYERYATRYVPRNFVIGRDGHVTALTVEYDAEEFEELMGHIDRITQE
ncbi:MAG: TlpA disulfide reductase family protein [Rikenellaceae bacterium]|nr:TlpA disulfide reductase family protein [Rikenellaceae bacterium]